VILDLSNIIDAETLQDKTWIKRGGHLR